MNKAWLRREPLSTEKAKDDVFSKTVILSVRWFCTPGNNVYRYFWLSQLWCGGMCCWIEDRDAAEHLIMHRTISTTKNYLVQVPKLPWLRNPVPQWPILSNGKPVEYTEISGLLSIEYRPLTWMEQGINSGFNFTWRLSIVSFMFEGFYCNFPF